MKYVEPDKKKDQLVHHVRINGVSQFQTGIHGKGYVYVNPDLIREFTRKTMLGQKPL